MGLPNRYPQPTWLGQHLAACCQARPRWEGREMSCSDNNSPAYLRHITHMRPLRCVCVYERGMTAAMAFAQRAGQSLRGS